MVITTKDVRIPVPSESRPKKKKDRELHIGPLTFYIHRPYRANPVFGETGGDFINKGWSVTEKVTGLAIITRQPTIKEAISKTRSILDRYNASEMIAIINYNKRTHHVG